MRRLIIFFIACFLAAPYRGAAQKPYNLKRLLKQAIANNSEIKKAALQQSESQYKIKETVAQGLPQLSGKIDYSKFGIGGINVSSGIISQLPPSVIPLLEQLKNIKALHVMSSNVTVTQLLYSRQYWTGIRQAKAVRDLYNVVANKTKDEVVYDVAALYYQLLNNYFSLQILNNIIQNLEKINKILELQYQNKLAKKTDVGRIKVQVANLKTKRITLQDAIKIRKRILKILCGIPLNNKIIIDSTEINSHAVKNPFIQTFSVNTLPSYKIMQKQKQLAELKIKSDLAKYYPNVVAYGQYNYGNYSTKFTLNNMSPSTTFGLEVNVPLFSSGERHSKVMQSRIELKKLNEDISTNTKQLGTNYENAADALVSAWKGLKDQQQNKALAKQVYNQVKLSFNEGMSSLTDLLNTESSYLEAENLYNQQLLKYRIARLDMKKATGSILSLIHEK